MNFTIETEQEDDGRWIAEVVELPGVIVYGQTRSDAIQSAEDLARRVIADRFARGQPDSELEGETVPKFPSIAKTSSKLSIVMVAFSTFAMLKIAVVASCFLAYKHEIDLCAAFALASSVVALIPFVILIARQFRMNPYVVPRIPFIIGLSLVLVCYLVSFALPAVIVWRDPAPGASAYIAAFSVTFLAVTKEPPDPGSLILVAGWFPNLLIWYAVCACSIGSYRPAMIAACVAVLAGLTWLIEFRGRVLVGFYVWIASFGLLFLFAATMDVWTKRTFKDSAIPRCN